MYECDVSITIKKRAFKHASAIWPHLFVGYLRYLLFRTLRYAHTAFRLGPSGVSLDESLKTVALWGVALLPGTYGSISSAPARGSGRLRANIAFTV
jgi:hypothetical protein